MKIEYVATCAGCGREPRFGLPGIRWTRRFGLWWCPTCKPKERQ